MSSKTHTRDNDLITFDLPMIFRVTKILKYEGHVQNKCRFGNKEH
jgi:hypothetical protein